MTNLDALKNDEILKPFFDRYPDFDLESFDFNNQEALDALNWDDLDKDTIIERLFSYQQLPILGVTPDEAKKIWEGMGDNVPQTKDYLLGAIVEAQDLNHYDIRDEIESRTGIRIRILFGGSGSSEKSSIQLPSYQQIFGSLDYLQCDPCQSIFSPAAYFVDLMRIVDSFITEKHEIAEHLKLNNRRPDLENIPLTCDNTNDTVSYTEIISEVLEKKLIFDRWKKEHQKENNTNKNQNSQNESLEKIIEAIEADIKNEIIWKDLATAQYPQSLPFNANLEQIRTYLGHLKTNLADIYQTFHPQKSDNNIWPREYLRLSPEDHKLKTSEKTDNLSDRYDVNISKDLGDLNKKDVFLKQTGLSWQELNDLLYQNLSKEEITESVAHQFYINRSLSNNQYLNLKKKDGIQNQDLKKKDGIIEYLIEYLDKKPFDRIDRFLRLAKKLDWSFADLDWVLTSIGVNDKKERILNDIDDKAIVKIAKIKHLQTQTKLPLDVLCSFWHDMKTYGKGDNPNKPQDLCNRIFNNHFIASGQEQWEITENKGKDWEIDGTDKNNLVIRKRLLAALQLSDGDFTDIAEVVKNKLKENSKSSNEDSKSNNSIKLNLANLSMLYRHALMLKLLGLKAQEYQLLLKFCGESLQNLEKLEIDTLIEILELAQWMKVSGFSVYELDYILYGTEYPFVEVLLPQEKMAASMKSLWQNVKLPVFVKLEELNEEDLDKLHKILGDKLTEEEKENLKKEKIEELVELVKSEKEDDKDKLKALSEKVNAEVAKESNEKIANHFGIQPGLFTVLAMATGVKTSVHDYTTLLLTNVKTKEANWLNTEVVKCLKSISRLYALTNKLALTEAELRSITKYPQAYNIKSVSQLTVKNIQTLYKFKQELVGSFNQPEEKLLDYLKNLSEKEKALAEFTEKAQKALAEFTGWNQEQIKRAIEYLTKSNPNPTKEGSQEGESQGEAGGDENQTTSNSFQDRTMHYTVEGLLKLKQCFDLSAKLGCNIHFLCQLCDLLEHEAEANNWKNYQNLAHSVTSLVKAKYDDEEWTKVFDKLNGSLSERKCQVLTEFALHKLEKENLRQLSEYLLLDVEMTSCACNSPIQLAILSVQTYLQRCRMGLEPGVSKVEIPEVWWEWIMNYRKWEANRKVFLYPENYIDPSLRKDASPIFKELQDELLQSDITAESVETAYRNYFDKFAEIARLQIVEGCRYWVTTPKSPDPIDTLFLFAKTITEPRTFYYRTCEHPEAEKPHWGYWQKIDLQINSEYLASVYAFNRLFVFWVETKEIKKSQDEAATTQSTVKYSFLNASQKWVSPQTLVADVKIPNNWKLEEINLDQEFWKQVYPIAVPEQDPQSAKITTIFGGLQSVSAGQFNTRRDNFIQVLDQIVKFTIDSDLLPSSIFSNHGNDSIKLTYASQYLAATTVGKFAIFADRGDKNLTKYSHMDIFKIDEHGKLVTYEYKGEKLTQARRGLAATTVGKFAIFAGGYDRQLAGFNEIDVFTIDESGELVKYEYKGEKLTQARGALAATTVGKFAIFAGGYSSSGDCNEIDVFTIDEHGELVTYEYKGEKLTQARRGLAATTVGKFAIFAGGYDRHLAGFNEIDVFTIDEHGKLVKYEYKGEKLTQARGALAATTVGKFAIFAGGYSSSGDCNEIDVFTIDEHGELVKYEYKGEKLTQARGDLAATTVGKFAIFAGGYGYPRYYNEIDVFTIDEHGELVKYEYKDKKLTQARERLAATTVGKFAIFAGGYSSRESNEIDVLGLPYATFCDLPTTPNIPTDTTITPIKNQSDGFILQHRSEAISTLCKNNQLTNETHLTTSTIQQFSHTLFAEGLDGLLSLESQQISESNFPGISNNKLDFDGAYGAYFWEIFFHIPFLIASTLNAHQRYNEARQWYQYIFNPTIPGENKDRFWRFLPFRGHTPEKLEQTLSNTAAIKAYKENPFDPYAIARLRIGAYEKAVVMKYIDNLLNWGDALFTQDNWESITQATTLYLLAYDLLGEKPKNLGKPPAREPKTYADIKGDKADFLFDLKNRPEYQEFIKQLGNDVPFNALDAYFCVSENQEFAQYWDRVEDRLFKIRHCQNIKGIERQLALFSPPIDPKQLVRQAAAGDGSMALSTTNDIPHYRFSYLLERAKGMVSTVIQLGSTVLNTLEKKDAEELAVLRATQEPILLQLITKTKEKQIEEAEANLKSLQLSLTSAKGRLEHYENLITGGWNAWEMSNVGLMGEALELQIAASIYRGASVVSYLLPNTFGLANGGMQFGDAAEMVAKTYDDIAGKLSFGASITSTVAQYKRRAQDWELQKNMADWDTQQIEAQIEAAKVRIDLAKAELDVHNKSIEHSRQVEQFYKDKFTNKDLYQWMVGRLSSIYFQTYKIALEMAYSAQKAYQYELAKDDSFLQPIHWDSNKKGLLAGESLMFGLNQLEKAYLEGNDRRLEIEKIISLRELKEDAFNNFKTNKTCSFGFTQQNFKDDFPNHYCRQIKTISVSIPAVVGPYQNINAMLTQTKNTVYTKHNSGGERTDWRSQQQIAISKGVNDNGMFVLNFQDERYLPFEGTGAISDWTLELSQNTPQNIIDSITDVIITISYTALYGG